MKNSISAGLVVALLPFTAFAAASTTPQIGSGPVHASVQIDGIAVPGVTGVQHLQAAVQYYQNHQNVKHHAYLLTILKPYSPGDALSSWWKMNRASRKSISVIFHSDAGAELARVNFSDCIPVKWTAPMLNAKNSGHATEKLSVRCTQISLR